MFVLCGLVVAFVLVQAVWFMRKAWRRGIELDMAPETMKTVMKSSFIFSIVPSLPILVFLLILMSALGRYFPWLRLSVVGSGMYENMAADLTAKSYELSGIADPGFNADIFVSAMWVMTIGIMWGLLCLVFGAKQIQKLISVVRSGSGGSAHAVTAIMFVTLLAVAAGPHLAAPFKAIAGREADLTPLAAMIVSGLCITFFDMMAKKSKSRAWIEFSFPVSLLAGMAAAALYSRVFA